MIDSRLMTFLNASDASVIIESFNRMTPVVRSSMVEHIRTISGLIEAPKYDWVRAEFTPAEDAVLSKVKSETFKNRALELNLMGLEPNRIAELCGVPVSKVDTALRSAANKGVRVNTEQAHKTEQSKTRLSNATVAKQLGMRPRADLIAEEHSFICEMRLKGASPRAVAQVLNVQTQTVCQINHSKLTTKGVSMPPIDPTLVVTSEDLEAFRKSRQAASDQKIEAVAS